jgi:hypothetical protein
MDALMLLIIGIAAAINILVIKVKVEKKRYGDATMDGSILVLLSYVFGGTFNGLITATVASSVVSIYLWFFPPKELFSLSKVIEEQKEKAIVSKATTEPGEQKRQRRPTRGELLTGRQRQPIQQQSAMDAFKTSLGTILK